MNKREKILACIVASLVIVVVLAYTAGKVNDSFRTKKREVARLEKEIRDKKDLDRFTEEFRDRMEVYKRRSLPSDLEEARSLYNEWLVNRAVDAGFTDPLVKHVQPRTTSKVYNALGFTITGKGNLEQLITFLYNFYSVDYLHRISRLQVSRVQGTKELNLTFWVDALSLPTATNEELGDQPSDRLAHEDLAAYHDVVVYRNLFGPPNNAPTLDVRDEVTGYKGRTLEITLAGKDPDESDTVYISLDGEGLPDAHVDKDSGRFEWLPKEVGVYDVTVKATDNGWPPKSVSQTFKIKVTEPPPEVPEPPHLPSFEMAKFAYVTGITEVDGRKETWIHLRTEGKMLELHEGDEFSIGEVKVTVKRISEKTVELEAAVLQKRLLVNLGQNVSEGNSLPPREG